MLVVCWYLFQLIVLLKPDFNCFYSFALSWVVKVTVGTKSFACVILNFVAPVPGEITQSPEQDKMRLISQVIYGIQNFSKNTLCILMTLLFQHPLYY